MSLVIEGEHLHSAIPLNIVFMHLFNKIFELKIECVINEDLLPVAVAALACTAITATATGKRSLNLIYTVI